MIHFNNDSVDFVAIMRGPWFQCARAMVCVTTVHLAIINVQLFLLFFGVRIKLRFAGWFGIVWHDTGRRKLTPRMGSNGHERKKRIDEMRHTKQTQPWFEDVRPLCPVRKKMEPNSDDCTHQATTIVVHPPKLV